MRPEVFFSSVHDGEKTEITISKIISLFQEAGLGLCVGENDLVAVKMHFGEEGNDTHIKPSLVRPIIKEVKKRKGKPFLTDTCVLYRSQRDNSVDHLQLAYKHGFRMEVVDAPIIISDGLIGSEEKTVRIPGKIFNEVSLASVAVEAGAIIVLSHVTGHIATGMAAAIKNLGMGFASRKGKLRQHSVMKPAISSKRCTGCEVCVKWCPADAISMNGDKAVIDSKLCIGCGECIAVCRFGAVNHDWNIGGDDLQKRMAEHALGVTVDRPGKVGYLNFLISITKDCDCFNIQQTPIIPDIGILASKDPVAIDAATLEIIKKEEGKHIADLTYPDIDPWVQIRHGEEIGLGSADYELVEIS